MIVLKVNIRTYGELKRVLGAKFMVKLRKDAMIKELVSKLREKMAPKDSYLGNDRVGSTIMVLINGCNIYSLNGLDTSLKDGDIVTFTPLVEGG